MANTLIAGFSSPLLSYFSPVLFSSLLFSPLLHQLSSCDRLGCSHQQVEGEGYNEEQAEGGVEGLVGRGGHEDVLVLINTDHVVADGGSVDVMPCDGTC